MNIRSITYFCDPGWPLDDEQLRQAGSFMAAARPAYENAGYPVQTTRLASVPFPRLVNGWGTAQQTSERASPVEQVVELAQALDESVAAQGIDYISLGPALPEVPESYAAIPAALSATQNTFLSGSMTGVDGRISLPAVRQCAKVISEAANISPDGFANLRFAALANVPAGAPFFPAAYHEGGAPVFALAIEAAVLAVDAFDGAPSLHAARQNLVEAMESHARAMEVVAQKLAESHSLRFGGIDFSLAPFPEEQRSLGTALERLGVPAVGLHGSLAAAAFLTDSVDRARYPRAGFSGLFLPVLEDAVLARRAAEGKLSVNDLLLLSAVCGTGLDTVPLPGDVDADELAAVLLDIAALACRLDKPLTARLMPIPGKRAGDLTSFDFSYFATSRVLALDARPLQGLLVGEESFDLKPRPPSGSEK